MIRTVAETGSTNADMLLLAASGAEEGVWLRAERQSGGRGRQGRVWASPVGNFYGSTVVRVHAGDPAAATLALVAAIALEEVVRVYLTDTVAPAEAGGAALGHAPAGARDAPAAPACAGATMWIKWPNDLLLNGAKLSGILLERSGDAVIVGIGINLAHHPDDTDRLATSLSDHGVTPDPADFAETLAEGFARWVAIWRGQGLAPIRARWLERAHPVGTALTARLPDGQAIDGLFGGLDGDGALILRLADGDSRVIHAGDVFLL
ncbi:biotin--[acetyl-CoA-carboxylase] ligase [Sphingomonas sp. 10B4]|uniref:biotin--[acetyl-CoA-carboxylase] ligase n=1 Tax=Sphingomonas sp. 10B4 TaxID=3048575 RepID=UPI002AB36C79|nr:biotin--[acetyl-CoA-carboxylase] ligase [Sphingomonas sp. 10B4]MDY7525166.1 biotin--[acetyl-CoA-carboxylase] ligase [Sphingomonas sp. 10B4]MEB0283290.1 biotin--[acetyl-CoA-carboxylase] ligase [Sphingomonas sp. 10B4]